MAGTQDNGTIRYTGSTVWDHIADGDHEIAVQAPFPAKGVVRVFDGPNGAAIRPVVKHMHARRHRRHHSPPKFQNVCR